MLIRLVPTFNNIGADGFPEITGNPFTATVSVASVVIGVTVMLVVALLTLVT